MNTPDNSKPYPIHIEGTFAEFPFFSFSRRNANKKFMTHEFCVKNSLGKEEKREIKIANAEYGVPGELEYDVFVWLLKKTYDADFIEKIHFTLGEIIKDLKLFQKSGKNYYGIKKALKCLSSTLIQFLNSFYIKGEYHSIKNFRIFSDYDYWEPEDAQKEGITKRMAQEKTYITWAPEFLENLKKDYYKIIDWNFFCSLKKAIERRLYILLEKKMGRKGEFFIGWEKLADLVPITTQDKYLRRKYLFDPLKTLATKGFLIYDENDSGVIHFTRVNRPTADEGNKSELYAILQRLKISSTAVKKKCSDLSTEALERYTAWIVWYVLEKEVKKEASSLFFNAIQKNWTPPEEFLLGWFKYTWKEVKQQVLEDKHWIENYTKNKREIDLENQIDTYKRKDSKPESIQDILMRQNTSPKGKKFSKSSK